MTGSSFSGVIREGRFLPDLDHWAIWQREHEGKRIILTADLERTVRSLRANRRYWSAVLPEAMAILNAGRELPLNKEQVHDRLKAAFIGTEDTPFGPVAKASKDLTGPKFNEFTTAIEEWLVHSHGVMVPEQGENW